MNCIELSQISLSFGGVRALENVSIAVKAGELHSIIGPNGSGKTSLLNSISGFYKPSEGSIIFNQSELLPLPSHKIARLGVGRTFQHGELFKHSSVIDNIKLGYHIHYKQGFLSNILFWGKTQREECVARESIEKEIIDLLELEHVRNEYTGNLPYGIQKRVDLARALAMKPKLLLLDEPVGGMNREEREEMVRYILDVHERWNLTVILVEHDMGIVMDISDTISVLNHGKKVAEGTPKEVLENSEVKKAYLGSDT